MERVRVILPIAPQTPSTHPNSRLFTFINGQPFQPLPPPPHPHTPRPTITLQAEFTMSSQLKKDTARANGAKSHGPKTPEGRARSSANSRRHGLTADTLLVSGESHDQFQLLLQDYVDQFHPATGVEMELVEAMAYARWRIRRLLALETNLFDNEIVRSSKAIDKEFNNMDVYARLGWVFQKLADGGQAIALLIRYETSLNRSYDRAFKQLQVIQSTRPSPLPPTPPPANLDSDLGSFRNLDPSENTPPEPSVPHESPGSLARPARKRGDQITNTEESIKSCDTFRPAQPLRLC
jgi:hypothetical protein